MGQGGKTAERLEMQAAKAGNYTPVVEEIDYWVARMQCLCSVYFQHYYLMLPHCHLGIVASQSCQLVEPYRLALVEIGSSTLYLRQIWF
jgi:hypothetical protein